MTTSLLDKSIMLVTSIQASLIDLVGPQLARVSLRVSSSGLSARDRRPLLVALAVSGAVASLAHLYRRVFRVPKHLEHLPRISAWKAIRLVLGSKDIIEQLELQVHLARIDALKRGVIASMDETPKLWAMWQMGAWRVVFANPDDCKDVLTKHEQFEKMSLDELPVDYFDLFLGRNIVQARTPVWKIHRRIVNPAFRRTWPTALFGHPTRQLIHHFDQLAQQGKPVDVADWMQRITLDVLSGAAFGASLDSLNHPTAPMVVSYNRLMGNFMDPSLVLSAMVFGRLVPRVRQLYADINTFNQHIHELIHETERHMVAKEQGTTGGIASQEDDQESRNLLEHMVCAQMQDAGHFSREELRANIAAFFAAGHDTTANALTFTIYLLGMHPQIQERARNEVIAVMGDVDPSAAAETLPFPSNNEQNRLEYLTFIIKESTRLYPPLISVPPRTLMQPYTFHKSHVTVPAGASVTASIWALHRAREYWGPDALDFNPDRWRTLSSRGVAPGTGTPEDSVVAESPGPVPLHPGAHGFQWIPFGGGQRLCIGQTFSVIEQRVVMATLLLRYTWKVVGNNNALKGRPDSSPGVLLHPVGIQVEMARRK